MKFVTVRDLRTTPAQIWKQLPDEQEMIITNNGRPIALLTPISDGTLEDTIAAVRKARAINAIKQMQLFSLKKGNSKLSEADIEKEIQEYRESRRK